VGTTLYDSVGRLQAVVDPLANTTTFSYDAAGRQTAIQSPLGNVLTTNYDADGRTLSSVNPLGYATTFGYDAAGRRVTVQDANGNTTTSVYDNAGRLTANVNALGNTTTFAYDAASNRTAITNARGNTTTFQYDSRNLLKAQIEPLGRRTTLQYDALGRLSTRRDGRNVLTTFTYDDDGRLTSRTYSGGPTSSPVTDAPSTFSYDAIGNRTLMWEGTGRTTFTYDAVDRPLTMTTPAAKTITYSYDPVGRRSLMTAPDGGVFTYGYFDNGQMQTVQNPQGDVTTWSYDAASRTTVRSLANGARVSYTYDNADQLTFIGNHKSDGTLLSSFTYAYDPAGNRTSVVDGSANRTTWTYDVTNRLRNEWRTGTNAYNVTHTYDAVGNRTSQVDGSGTKNYTYDIADELTSGPAPNGTLTYTYDGAGNLATQYYPSGSPPSLLITTYTWDGENRLLRAQSSATHVDVSYKYNADGQRVQGPSSKYIWDGQTYLMETDLANNPNVVYTQGSGTYGDLISQRRKSGSIWTPSYYVFDGIGSTDRVLDSSQASLATYLFRAYGDLVTSTGSLTNAFQYIGRWGYYFDSAGISDYYVRARWYRTGIARWLSIDAIWPYGDINWYRYVMNNPISGIDPAGLDCPGCDVPGWLGGDSLNNDPCARACCAVHDQCYFKNDCDYTSWGWNILGVIGGWFCEGAYGSLEGALIAGDISTCAGCNNQVVACLAVCATSTGTSMKGKPEYFCANKKDPHGGKFITVGPPPCVPPPCDFPNITAAKKACCTGGAAPPPPPPRGRRKPPIKAVGCFPRGTLVHTPSGLLPIESICSGEFVVTYDVAKQTLVSTRVTQVLVHDTLKDWKLLRFLIDGCHALMVTPEHPVYDGDAWRPMGSIVEPRRVFSSSLGRVELVPAMGSNSIVARVVYNLLTEEGTFMIGIHGLLVSGELGWEDAPYGCLNKSYLAA
jgi:RHS repeat-associated protein